MITKPVAVASVTSEDKPYAVRIDRGGHALRGDERSVTVAETPPSTGADHMQTASPQHLSAHLRTADR